MEIEAKWEISPETYDEVRAALPDKGTFESYRLDVRWQGRVRRFRDVYYDARDRRLGIAQHSLRHRSQARADVPSGTRDVALLDRATWVTEWERVQYKSTPCRQGAVWFRTETGECKLHDTGGEELCLTPRAVLSGLPYEHEAMAALRRDHPAFPFALEPFLTVTDYRYRVEFARGKPSLYELSLDMLREGDVPTPSYELELEIIARPLDASLVHGLFDLVAAFERRFQGKLRPSVHSKGHVGSNDGMVPECASR